MNNPSLLIATAGFWLGGLVTLELIETPAKFRIPSISRESAVELGTVVFRRLGMLELVMATAMAAMAFDAAVPRAAAMGCWLLAALCAFTTLVLRSRLDTLTTVWLERRRAGEMGSTLPEFDRFHKLNVYADVVKLILLAGVIVLMAAR